MNDKIEINLSVHDLVDFLYRSGDIDNRVFNKDTMIRGSELHSIYQKNKSISYHSEFYLKTSDVYKEFIFNIDGKADGITFEKVPVIEEIKTTIDDINKFHVENEKWHLSQAICYAYMYLKQYKFDKCIIRLLYMSQINNAQNIFEYKFEFKEIEKEYFIYLQEYSNYYLLFNKHKIKRNKTAEEMNFPFNFIRKGQDKFIDLSVDIASNGGVAFIEAPTGIGKTMASLYPFIKSFKDNKNDKVFYLTAKNTGKDAAYNAAKILVDSGLELKGIYISAKEKMCQCKNASCNPIECPFAKSYYNKLKDAILFCFTNYNLLNSFDIIKIAKKFQMCPFELSLDLANQIDLVIADYNYFFDPIAKLERFFDIKEEKYLVLVDEAHNLYRRTCEMYSETLSYNLFLQFKNNYKKKATKKLTNSINRLDKIFKSLYDNNENYQTIIDDIPHELYLALNNLETNLREYHQNHIVKRSDAAIEFSRNIHKFLTLYEIKEQQDILYIDKFIDVDIKICLYCFDPSNRIREALSSIKGAILFSATLTPFEYYFTILGGLETDRKLIIPSPFDPRNFSLLISPISLIYKDRDKTLNEVVSQIKEFVKTKKGNYLIFSPSFEYLNKIIPYFNEDENTQILVQKRDMNDKDRNEFIDTFKNKKTETILGFVVVGGAFSEGIDLVNDSLIGVAVIGVGLPTISFEINTIKEYYDNKFNGQGFNFAYKFPGINKVTQAIGRLIRSEYDVGAALIIDNRYLFNSYLPYIKNKWDSFTLVYNNDDIKNRLFEFYNYHKKH